RTPARTAPGTARRASGPATSRSSACAELAHLDDDVLLPQLGQGAGGLLPGLGIADRLHVGVLLVGQQLALHVRRQGQVLGADRSGMPLGQVDLSGVGEDVFRSEERRVGKEWRYRAATRGY